MVSSAYEDRKLLEWDITKYNAMAEMLASNSYQNKQGDWCSIPKAKTKKLKNIRANLLNHPHQEDSMILREYLRRLNHEIRKRNKPKR